MIKRITVVLSCIAPMFAMEIFIPNDREADEYIDELLDSMLADEFRYNVEWYYE